MFHKKKIGKTLLAAAFCFSAMTANAFANGESIEILKNSIQGAIQDASDVAANDVEVSFFYNEGQLYRIYCRPGYLTDIKLHPGEDIVFVGGGDTSRWIIDSTKFGTGEKVMSHLYIKPTKAGTATNLIINTTNHTYQLQINAVDDWYNPIISWQYPHEELAAKLVKEAKDEAFYAQKSLAINSPEYLNFEYKIENKGFSWNPTSVFDDTQKTFIKLPSTLSAGDAPVIFIKEGKKLSLVNTRIKGDFLIVDRLFDEAVMRSNTEESLTIKRKK